MRGADGQRMGKGEEGVREGLERGKGGEGNEEMNIHKCGNAGRFPPKATAPRRLSSLSSSANFFHQSPSSSPTICLLMIGSSPVTCWWVGG
jgi:hypothetical protein